MNSVAAVGGGAPAGDSTDHDDRYTIGIDSRWRSGPFGLDSTVYYQWGKYDTQAIRTNGQVAQVEGEAAAWLLDVISSYQAGPLLLEVRGIYSTGNKARDNLSRGKRYFEPLDLKGTSYAGWAAILAITDVDYFSGNGVGMASNVCYGMCQRL